MKVSSRPGRGVAGGQSHAVSKSSSLVAPLPRARLECQDFQRPLDHRAATCASQHPITVTERRPAAPGLSHLLFQDFLSDSIRKLRHHLLLSLFTRQAQAGLSGSFPIHLLRSYRPTPRRSSSYFSYGDYNSQNAPFPSTTQ